MSANSIFRKEEAIIRAAEAELEKNPELPGHYHELLDAYKKLLKQSNKLIKLSDKQQHRLNELNTKLEVASAFIKKTFGRYLSDEVVKEILESSEGPGLESEKRVTTILMSDIRGFSYISEQFPAEDIVAIINLYLSAMTTIIMKHGGTINEFIGDSILAIFGAPLTHPDDHERAVACALEMQLAMDEVNEQCVSNGYPRIEQGIGINTGEVIVGNIGSDKRTKYGVVGSNVNHTSRIESCTLGGEILISESTRDACGDILEIGGTRVICPKGLNREATIYDVRGIRGAYNLSLNKRDKDLLVTLDPPASITFSVIREKQIQKKAHQARIVKLSPWAMELEGGGTFADQTDIVLSLVDEKGRERCPSIFGKFIGKKSAKAPAVCNFTFVPPAAEPVLQKLLKNRG